MNYGYGKVGSITNWEKDKKKLSEMIFGLSNMVCLILLRVPRVNSFSLMAEYKSTMNSSLGSAFLHDLMVLVTILMSV